MTHYLEAVRSEVSTTPSSATPETDADTSAASGRLAAMLEELSTDERTIPHDVYLALAARHIRRLLKKEDAAERERDALKAERHELSRINGKAIADLARDRQELKAENGRLRAVVQAAADAGGNYCDLIRAGDLAREVLAGKEGA